MPAGRRGKRHPVAVWCLRLWAVYRGRRERAATVARLPEQGFWGGPSTAGAGALCRLSQVKAKVSHRLILPSAGGRVVIPLALGAGTPPAVRGNPASSLAAWTGLSLHRTILLSGV